MNDLTEREKTECVALVYPNGPVKTWADLSPADAAENARWWRKQHPLPRAPAKASAQNFLTVEEAGDFAEGIGKQYREYVDERIAQSESGIATAIEAALAAAESASAAIGKAGGGNSTVTVADERVDQVLKALDEVRTTQQSQTRQLERHASHLGSLETKVQALKKG